MLRPEQIHFFNDIGYHHLPFQHCPAAQTAMQDKCSCKAEENFDLEQFSCTKRWFDLFGGGNTSSLSSS